VAASPYADAMPFVGEECVPMSVRLDSCKGATVKIGDKNAR
jgi:hypothetical protein